MMQVMAPINALYSNHESKNEFMRYLSTFSENGLQYNARKEEEAKELLKKYKEHLVKSKLERNYYIKNTKLAEQQRKLVNEHFITGNKANYCSVDATAHYSYDWAQIVHVPHSDQQVSKIYYLSPRKVHLFGIQDEAVREQINYRERSEWYAEHGIRLNKEIE